MKNLLLALLVTTVTGTAQTASTEPTTKANMPAIRNFPAMDIYAVAPNNLNGAGFGMGIFSPALEVPFLSATGAELRVGGDFHFAALDRTTMRNVPLAAPQAGDAKVRLNESMFAFNAVARLSMPWSAKLSPYVDGFAGLRMITTGIAVTPNQYQPGYEESTSDNLDAAYAFQYGAAAGVLISLGKDIKLNAGLIYSRSERPGTVSDIHTASLAGTGIVLDRKALSHEMLTFKLGITFRINPSSESSKRGCCRCCGNTITGGGIFIPSVSRGAPNRVSISPRVNR